jgi:hypothetical protein
MSVWQQYPASSDSTRLSFCQPKSPCPSLPWLSHATPFPSISRHPPINELTTLGLADDYPRQCTTMNSSGGSPLHPHHLMVRRPNHALSPFATPPPPAPPPHPDALPTPPRRAGPASSPRSPDFPDPSTLALPSGGGLVYRSAVSPLDSHVPVPSSGCDLEAWRDGRQGHSMYLD